MKIKILLLEDDVSLGETLCHVLSKENYTVSWAQNIADATKLNHTSEFHLAILDIGLPDGSGLEFSKQMSNTPFLFLTALNNAESRLQGYELGAEEYIPKPFHLKELLLRIKKTLESVTVIDMYDFSNYRIEKSTMKLFFNGELIEQLKLRDFQVLSHLIDQSPRIVSREELLNEFWGEGNYPSTRTIDNTIVRLRSFFSKDSKEWITSIRAVGYQWNKQ